MARLLSIVALLAIVSMAFAHTVDRYPESRNNQCSNNDDCVTTSICAPTPPDPRSNECGLACCYPSGAVAVDSAYCCDPANSAEICGECGIWACNSPCGFIEEQ